MVPHPSSAIPMGTFIGRGRHLRGSAVKKNTCEDREWYSGKGRAACSRTPGRPRVARFGGLFWRPVLVAWFGGMFWRPFLVACFGGSFGVRCGQDVPVLATCTVFCLPGRHSNCRHQTLCEEGGTPCPTKIAVRVGFSIGGKSVTELAHNLDFVGKVFDLKRGTLENRSGMLRGLVRLWLLLVLGLLNRKGMERLLGRLEWALGPSVGLNPLLGGAYFWKHTGGRRVLRALLRRRLTAICFAFVPHKYPIRARVQAEPPSCWGEHVLFVDAAFVGEVSKASPAGAEIRCKNWPGLISSPMVTWWPVLAAFFGGLFWRLVLAACFGGLF